MSEKIGVEFAIWHPSIGAAEIIDAIGLPAKISWSVGDLNPKTKIVRDRTYCRFHLGNFAQLDLSKIVEIMEKIPEKSVSKIILDEGTRGVWYFNRRNLSEIYLSKFLVKKISQFGMEIVVV